MTEPILFGFPISLLFLYFILYSFAGWVMETIHCSHLEQRFVARGFLYGPVCPIYGAGALMMICWFSPFLNRPVLFFVVATVCMTAWEYLVGWFLETTTHIKYWDYSNQRFHIKGRVCLRNTLIWGALSYVVIYWVHPTVAGLVTRVPEKTRHVLAIAALILILVDAAATIRNLALVSKLMRTLGEAGDELKLQLSLGKAELSDYLEGTLRPRYEDLLIKAERASRHLRHVYQGMSSKTLAAPLAAVMAAGRKYLEEKRPKKK